MFIYSLKRFNDNSLLMLMHGLFEKSLILGKDSIRGEFRENYDDKLFISEDSYLYETLLEEYIDFDVMHKKPFKCVTSRVDLSLTPGSSGSMMFLKLIEEAEDEIIYRSDLHFFVDYKWEK